MSYSDKVIDHYNNPRNVGSMDETDLGEGPTAPHPMAKAEFK